MSADVPPPSAKRLFFLCTGECVEYANLYLHPNSHILGELRYLTDDGRKVTALALYETTARADQVPPLRPDIRVYLIGDARMIKCRYADCENIQRWEIGKAAFEQLMKRYRKDVEYPEDINEKDKSVVPEMPNST
jgi:hypothetical protein